MFTKIKFRSSKLLTGHTNTLLLIHIFLVQKPVNWEGELCLCRLKYNYAKPRISREHAMTVSSSTVVIPIGLWLLKPLMRELNCVIFVECFWSPTLQNGNVWHHVPILPQQPVLHNLCFIICDTTITKYSYSLKMRQNFLPLGKMR